jgi:hypothetical protein
MAYDSYLSSFIANFRSRSLGRNKSRSRIKVPSGQMTERWLMIFDTVTGNDTGHCSPLNRECQP